MARMIFVCSKCNSTYGASSGTQNICPDCKIPLIETSITTDFWRTLSNSQKEQVWPQLLQMGKGKHMIFCRHCGKALMDERVICPSCGCLKEPLKAEVDQSISVGLIALSLLFPLVGCIYFFAAIKTRPTCAKVCIIVAIISWPTGLSDFMCGFIFGFLSACLGIM